MTGEIDKKELNMWLEKIINNKNENSDLIAISSFCLIVRKNPKNVRYSIERIISLIKSSKLKTSLEALELANECMSKCGPEFQNEFAKNRYLNEIVKLVSINFSGKETSIELKNGIMTYLQLWSIQYSDKIKIKDAFELLCKERKTPCNKSEIKSMSNRNLSILTPETEKKFKILINSKNPENHGLANLLVQAAYNQLEKQRQLASQQEVEIDEILNITDLLDEVLDSYKEDPNNDVELIEELYVRCQEKESFISRILEIIENNQILFDKAFKVNERLQSVLKRYKNMQSNDKKIEETIEPSANIEKLCDVDSEYASCPQELSSIQPLEELNDIFATIPNIQDDATGTLRPTSINNDSTELELVEIIPQAKISTVKNNHLESLDNLCKDIFPKILNKDEKISKLKKDSISPKKSLNMLCKNKSEGLSINKFHKKPESQETLPNLMKNENLTELLTTKADQPKKSNLINLEEGETNFILNNNNNFTAQKIVNGYFDLYEKNDEKKIQSLSEINIDINSIKPSKIKPIIVKNDEEFLHIAMSFALNQPQKDIFVIVLCTINQGSTIIKDYHLEASVKKPCKLRLLPPSGNSIEAMEPFGGPKGYIRQVMLLFNPSNKPVDINYIVSYKIGDDPDQTKELLVAKNVFSH